ncbi:MAG: hypothetical protein KGL10_07040 [Alphaproteobacteria bacterium]|nr:hypothetical protein [Alphaproteobacteria bacterium]
MRKSLTSRAQEFNRTSAAAYAAFPLQLERLTVLLVPTSDTPVYVAPAVAEKLSQNIAGVKKAVTDLSDLMQKHGWAGLANKCEYVAGTPVNLIALKGNLPGIFYKSCTKEMRELFVLDHELGHHVTEKGIGGGYSSEMKESSADAYAALRHVQRFGKDTLFIKKRGNIMAANIVLHADAAHYTTDTIHRALQVAEEQDVSRLPLEETAALAGKIADETCLNAGTAIKVRNAYLPVNRACRKHIGGVSEVVDKIVARDSTAYDLICRETIAVMRAHVSDADIFEAGSRFLTGHSSWMKFVKKHAKTDSFYKDALDFLKKGPSASVPAPQALSVSQPQALSVSQPQALSVSQPQALSASLPPRRQGPAGNGL